MKSYKIPLILLPVFLALLFACEQEPNKPDLPDEVLILNHWIWNGLHDVYLWEDYLPDLDPDYQEDPEAYFYDLLYYQDRYSWIVDDYEALEAMFDGVELVTGMSTRGYLISGSTVVGAVEYVSEDSPAADSSIERGDLIIAVDGTSLNVNNYYELMGQTKATYEFGVWTGTTVIPNGRKVTLIAEQVNQNPVVHSEIIEYEGKKIGYLVYTQFTYGPADEWLEELNGVFEAFLAAGVSDVVVDLRYNRGGYGYVAEYMASTLAPGSVNENEDVFLRLIWNDAYNQFWKEYDLDEDGEPDGENSSQMVVRFPGSELNMDLSKVYFLTADLTASASESLMIGLYPYMEVVQVGGTTYGKCYGSWTIRDTEDPPRHSWAMQPIVLKYANAEGFTDFINGIFPDFLVQDNLLEAEPFGSLADPHLAKALEQITGVMPGLKSRRVAPEGIKALPVPRYYMRDFPYRKGSLIQRD